MDVLSYCVSRMKNQTESGRAIVCNGEKVIHQIAEIGQIIEILTGIFAVGEQIYIQRTTEVHDFPRVADEVFSMYKWHCNRRNITKA